jgi:integrase
VATHIGKIDGNWYLHIRQFGKRGAKKCVDFEHACELKKWVDNKMTIGEFSLADFKAQRHKKEESKEESKKPTGPTLAEFFDKTMSAYWEAHLAKGTWSRYEVSFRLHIRPLGGIAIDELNRDQVKDFITSLLSKNAAKRTHGEERQAEEAERKLSKDSIRNVVAALRAMLNEAIERKLISVNPATKLGKLYKEAGSVRDQVDPFTAEEIPLLLNATRTRYGYENYVLTLLLFHTGLRASEAAGLQWSDLDTRERFITVRRQYKAGIIKRTKTKKIRKVDVSSVLLSELQTLRKRRQEEYLGRGKNEIPEWVFLSPARFFGVKVSRLAVRKASRWI